MKMKMKITTCLKLFQNSIVNAGEAFGDFSKIIDKKYIPWYAIIESDSAKILQFERKHVDSLVRKLAISAKFDGLIKFITSVIPSFAKMSAIARDRMGRCFKERHYLPGMMIVKEGTPCTKLHLVMKGDALLKSTRSPIESEVGPLGEMYIMDNKVITKKGFISDTVNTFQIGMKTEKQWVGEESLVFEEGGVYPYKLLF